MDFINEVLPAITLLVLAIGGFAFAYIGANRR